MLIPYVAHWYSMLIYLRVSLYPRSNMSKRVRPALLIDSISPSIIAPGPNKPMLPPVDAWTFLMLCRTRFPNAIISIGWTTDHETLCHKQGYNRDMVDHMASVVKEYSLLQPLTFPVNGALLKYSICEMQRLLYQVISNFDQVPIGLQDIIEPSLSCHQQTPNSTLTVWSHQEDPITVDDLLIIRKAFGTHQLFYDMPDSILQPFKNEVYGR